MMYNMSMLRHRFSNEWGGGGALHPYQDFTLYSDLHNNCDVTDINGILLLETM